MRKILADIIGQASMINEAPEGHQRTPKISEPDSGNIGRCGVAGVGRHIYSKQELELQIEHAGSLGGVYDDVGARFYFTPDYLKDTSGDENCDSYSQVGTVQRQHLHHSQIIESLGYEITSPRVCRLEHWTGKESNAGNVALMAYLKSSAASGYTIAVKVMKAEPAGYKWEDSTTITVGAIVGSYRPHVDIVEMHDGTIMLIAFISNELWVYRSFDGGATFDNITTVSSVNGRDATDSGMTIERIGSRIVVVTGYSDGSDQYVYGHVSDDAGETWDKNNTLWSGAIVAPFQGKLVRGDDGWLYLFYSHSGYNLYVDKTRDGLNWHEGSGGTQIHAAGTNVRDCTAIQTRERSWWVYRVSTTGTRGVFASERNDEDAYGSFGTEYEINPMNLDQDRGASDRLLCYEIDATTVFDDCFTEAVVVYKDAHTSNNWMIVTHRCGMWSGISHDEGTEADVVWTAHTYPSESDGAPNIDTWERTKSSANSPVLRTSELGYLQFATAAASDTMYYYLSNGTRSIPIGDGLDNGVVVKIELKVVSGDFHVKFVLNDVSGGGDDQIDVVVVFNSSNIQIYDENAGGGSGAVLSTFTPTNWDPQEWNTYWIAVRGTSMYIWRAGSGEYREILHFEYAGEADDEFTYSLAVDVTDQLIAWGHILNLASGTTNAYVRSVQIFDACTDGLATANKSTSVIGKRAHYEPVGLLQGLSARFGGEYAAEDDVWSLDVGSVYAPENIFLPSPSVVWKENEQTAGVDSPARVFDIIVGEDVYANDLSMIGQGIALFGRNFLDFKLEGGTASWASPTTTIFDSETTHDAYFAKYGVGSDSSENRLDVYPVSGTTSGNYAGMIPNMFASDGFHIWYVKMTAGAQDGDIYKILENDERYLYLDINAVDRGIAEDDLFVIFSSSIFVELSSTAFYERYKLTIPAQSRHYDDLSLQLGTMILGRIHEIDDDDWESSYRHVPNNAVLDAPSGRRRVVKNGPMRRSVELQYSGMTDRGMSKVGPVELFRLLGGGETPLVWIDHDDIFDSVDGHSSPLLCRALNPLSARRAAYENFDDSFPEGLGHGSSMIYNVLDIESLVLEEEL